MFGRSLRCPAPADCRVACWLWGGVVPGPSEAIPAAAVVFEMNSLRLGKFL